MPRVAFMMRLKPGNEAIYKEKHDQIWPEMVSLLRESGVRNYSIFRRDLDLFAYLETDEGASLPGSSGEIPPVLRDWWTMMEPYMEYNPDHTPKTWPLEDMFHLDWPCSPFPPTFGGKGARGLGGQTVTRATDRIADVRAYVSVSGKQTGDYHAQASGHWIRDSIIANPMSVYPAYHATRSSWGIDAHGGVVVEIETEGGLIGIGVTQGGDAAGIVIERHLSRYLVGSDPRDIERIWDQMWRGSLYYGRKGLVICAISAIDLALWDLAGKLRDEPVYKVLGGQTTDAIPCYVTGIKPARYQELGFFGAKMPLPYGPADGRAGLLKNIAMVEQARSEVGPDFDLMLDCYMSLDVPYTIELANELRPYRVRWIEEPLPPDDYEGHARIKVACPWQRITTGEHEWSRYGFRDLIARANVDLLQPDLSWVGGVTEAKKIAALAAAHDLPVVPHGSGVFSSHFVMATPNAPFQEILAMSPDGESIVPLWGDLLQGDPLPENGVIRPPDRPGWGVELNRARVRRAMSNAGEHQADNAGLAEASS